MTQLVLVLNGGSSSLKFGLYRTERATATKLVEGSLGHDASVPQIASWLADAGSPALTAIAYRIVHGGPSLTDHVRIDADVVARLRAATGLAPLHIPAALTMIDQARARYPDLPQIACFDTAFHAALPPIAHTLPLPNALRDEGIRRYGFHGLSCESVLHQLGLGAPDRIVIAHLGGGSSVTAIRTGRSVDTSMGLTPSGGVVMATRSGDLDPGVLFWLMRAKGLGVDALEAMIDRRSGLHGISGISGDMRELHAAATHPAARLAIDIFCASVRKQIAAMISVLAGIDLLVFTGGIGEHDGVVRAAICEELRWAGISEDTVRVIPSQENAQIARHAQAILEPG